MSHHIIRNISDGTCKDQFVLHSLNKKLSKLLRKQFNLSLHELPWGLYSVEADCLLLYWGINGTKSHSQIFNPCHYWSQTECHTDTTTVYWYFNHRNSLWSGVNEGLTEFGKKTSFTTNIFSFLSFDGSIVKLVHSRSKWLFVINNPDNPWKFGT